jgi:lysophospholipase L1-like esterase
MSYFVPRPTDRKRLLLILLYAALFGVLWIGPAWVRVPVGAVGLAAAFGLTWMLYGFTLKYYQDWIRSGLDPLGLTYYRKPEGPPSPRPRPLVLFYGDSRAQAWPPPAGPLPFDIANRALSGQTTTQALHRLAADLAPLRPDAVVLQVGVNDLKCLPFFRGLERRIIDECKANIRRIVAECLDLGATVVLTTIFPIGPVPFYRRPFWTDAVRDAVLEVNRDLASLGSDQVRIFDAHALLLHGAAVARPYTMDTLHINKAGYEHLNAHLVEALMELDLGAGGRVAAV